MANMANSEKSGWGELAKNVLVVGLLGAVAVGGVALLVAA